MKDKPQKNTVHWEELDILRGLAAVLMIVNHAGYKTLAPNQIDGSLAGSLLFIGSFAPVLFFFVTGVGYGVQSKKKTASRWYVIFNKIAILLLADALMQWSEGRWLGLDFLGFIGISSLVLEFLRRLKSPLVYAIAGFAGISLMRYLLGPYIHSLGYDRQLWGLGFIVGTSDTPGVSYPLSPWMAYPFAGYIVGITAMHYRSFIEAHRLRVISGLLLIAVFPAVVGLILAQHGASFFRWGTMALGFYIVSFAVLLSSLAYSLLTCAGPRLRVWRNVLSLKGIASLAVVPLHYFILESIVFFGGKDWSYLAFSTITVSVLIVSFLLARFLEATIQSLRQFNHRNILWLNLATIFLLASVVTLILNKESIFSVVLARSTGQIALCFLLVIHPRFSNVRLGTIHK